MFPKNLLTFPNCEAVTIFFRLDSEFSGSKDLGIIKFCSFISRQRKWGSEEIKDVPKLSR